MVRMRVAVVALALVGVGGVARAQDNTTPADAGKAAQVAKTPAVDFRKLKELMPAELGGLKRTESNGEKNQFGGMSISQAKAEYKKNKDQDDEKEPTIRVEVIDYAGVDMAKGLAAAWTMAEVDRESDGGYEKTVKIKGQPGMETWEKENKHGRVQVLVGSRFILTVETNNLPSEQVIKIVESYPLEKLAALK